MRQGGGERPGGGHPRSTGLPGGPRFRLGRWRILEEAKDSGVLSVESSRKILMLKPEPTQFLRM